MVHGFVGNYNRYGFYTMYVDHVEWSLAQLGQNKLNDKERKVCERVLKNDDELNRFAVTK